MINEYFKSIVDEYFDNISPEEVVSKLESLGYEFSDFLPYYEAPKLTLRNTRFPHLRNVRFIHFKEYSDFISIKNIQEKHVVDKEVLGCLSEKSNFISNDTSRFEWILAA